MPDRKQLYTVKRIETGEPRNSTGVKPAVFEILGPGAPEKPIASEPIAIMIRDALEEAGQALVAKTREQTLAEIDAAAAARADHTQDLVACAPSRTSTDWEIYGLPDPESAWQGETFTAALLDGGGECDSCGKTVPTGDLASIEYEQNGVGDGEFCGNCRGGRNG